MYNVPVIKAFMKYDMLFKLWWTPNQQQWHKVTLNVYMSFSMWGQLISWQEG